MLVWLLHVFCDWFSGHGLASTATSTKKKVQGRTIVNTGAKKRDGASSMLSLSIPAPREPSESRVAMGKEPSSPRIASEEDLTRALDVLREFGMVGVGLDGQVASSLRRHAASALQNQVGRAQT